MIQHFQVRRLKLNWYPAARYCGVAKMRGRDRLIKYLVPEASLVPAEWFRRTWQSEKIVHKSGATRTLYQRSMLGAMVSQEVDPRHHEKD